MPNQIGNAVSPFTVVLPVFNEEAGLRGVLDELREVLKTSGAVSEIVVVDDGSTDGTPAILATFTDVRTVRHDVNRGYGAALKAGIAIAKYPVVVIMDSDGTYPASRIPQLAAACTTADMVVGARRTGVSPTALRQAVKWFFRQFAQVVSGERIPDLNSGLRAMRRSTVDRFIHLLPNGFSFTTTTTVASLMSGLDVRFEPIEYRPRIGRSKFHPIRDTYRIGRQIIGVGLNLAPVRTLIILAAPVATAAVACIGSRGDVRVTLLAFALAIAGTWLAASPPE